MKYYFAFMFFILTVFLCGLIKEEKRKQDNIINQDGHIYILKPKEGYFHDPHCQECKKGIYLDQKAI